VVGLDEPRAFALKPLERAGAEDQDNVAAVGFEPLQRLFGADRAPVAFGLYREKRGGDRVACRDRLELFRLATAGKRSKTALLFFIDRKNSPRESSCGPAVTIESET
jgi:hypothetical protein